MNRKRLASLFAPILFVVALPVYAQNGGLWGPTMTFATNSWPDMLVAVHMVHMPPGVDAQSGRILIWGFGVEGSSDPWLRATQFYVWDTAPVPVGETSFIHSTFTRSVAPDASLLFPNGDMFCAGHTGMGNGQVMINGGETTIQGPGITTSCIFDPFLLRWELADEMSYKRWYPTTTPLANGEPLTTAGLAGSPTTHSDIPERFTSNMLWADVDAYIQGTQQRFKSDPYPFMFTFDDKDPATDLTVFWAGKRQYEPTTNEALRSWILQVQPSPIWRTPTPTQDIPAQGSGAVMWIDGTDPIKSGKIIKCGGLGDYVGGVPPPGLPAHYNATDQVWWIDLDGYSSTPIPHWSSGWSPPPGAGGTMNHARIECNMVFDPTGRIVVFGGSNKEERITNWYPDNQYAVFPTEWFDPANPTGGWTDWASTPVRRWYHSSVVMQPDGSYLVGGGNFEPNGNIFYPPYSFGLRPQITGAPSVINYGSTFDVTAQLPVGRSLSKVTLIRLHATTHGFDMSQRFIRCSITVAGSTASVKGPRSGGVAPPGFYMMFVIDSQGAPSPAKYVNIQ